MPLPDTRYAWNGNIALAYQTLGDGPSDILYLQGWESHLELNWDSPSLARFLRGLASLGRLIVTDRRGWGCSERFSPSDVPPMETLTDDLGVVMDACGCERIVLIASLESTEIAMLFAATHPQRVSSLILIDPWVRYTRTDETPWMMSDEELDEIGQELSSDYPLPRWIEGPEDAERAWLKRYIRCGLAPGAAKAEFERFRETDVRDVLPSIQVPTLVLSDADGEDDNDPANGRYVADRIPGARLILHAGGADVGFRWHHWYARGEPIVRAIESFLRDLRDEEARFDRVLATVLFSDIVDSTRTAAEIGDAAWRKLVERHHAVVRAMLTRYRGNEVDTAGDGFFATFDGPARAIRCAQAIVDAVQPLGLQIRAGLHTGEVETIDGKVGGLAVAIGARVGAKAAGSEVLVSQTVKDLVAGSGVAFADAGEHELKGVPDRWHLYRVKST
jgi:class 3 adenylate cyclase